MTVFFSSMAWLQERRPLQISKNLNVSLFCFLVLLAGMAQLLKAQNYICPKECVCYEHLSTVDCGSGKLARIPFMSNTTTRLYIGRNHISNLPLGALQRTPKLILIDLRNNKITTFETLTLIGLEHLEQIGLKRNRLSSFKIMRSVHIDKLRILDLSQNHLTEIPANLSVFAPHLEVLNLTGNLIRSLWFDPSYNIMQSLKVLQIGYNPIRILKYSDFHFIRNLSLETLSLSGCSLSMIENGSFYGFENLTSLSLAKNFVPSSFLIAAINGLYSVQQLLKLDLSNSLITNITDESLSAFSNLKILNLSNSSIEFLDPGVFEGMSGIESLLLSFNKLYRLTGLNRLNNLQRLEVAGNFLEYINISMLENLRVVDLSGNRFTHIPHRWIKKSDTLQILNLSHNQLTHISRKAFDGLTLQSLDLSYNMLSSISSYGIIKPTHLKLSHNKIQSFNSDSFSHMFGILQFLDLSYNELNTLPNITYQSFVALQKLSLANNNLGNFFKVTKYHSFYHSLAHLQVLDLGHNNITTLSSHLLENLSHLTTLKLWDNKISDFSSLALQFLKSLSVLDLSGNRLSTIDISSLLTLEYLEIVDFSRNPFWCTCGLLHFVQWINSTIASVVGLNNPSKYQCASPSVLEGCYIMDYHPTVKECMDHKDHNVTWDLTVFGAVAGTTAFLSLLIAALFHFGKICHHLKSLHYKWQIRYRTVADVEFVPDPKV